MGEEARVGVQVELRGIDEAIAGWQKFWQAATNPGASIGSPFNPLVSGLPADLPGDATKAPGGSASFGSLSSYSPGPMTSPGPSPLGGGMPSGGGPISIGTVNSMSIQASVLNLSIGAVYGGANLIGGGVTGSGGAGVSVGALGTAQGASIPGALTSPGPGALTSPGVSGGMAPGAGGISGGSAASSGLGPIPSDTADTGSATSDGAGGNALLTWLGRGLRGYGYYRLAQTVAHEAGAVTQHALGGGDMRESQMYLQMAQGIPMLNLLSPLFTPFADKIKELQAASEITRRAGFQFSVGYGMFESPTLLRETQAWALSGLEMPPWIGPDFAAKEGSPGYLPPEARSTYLAAIRRMRQSPEVMAAIGYDSSQFGRMDPLRTALSGGDFASAEILWNYLGSEQVVDTLGPDGQTIRRNLKQERDVQAQLLKQAYDRQIYGREGALHEVRAREYGLYGAYQSESKEQSIIASIHNSISRTYDQEIQEARGREEWAKANGDRASELAARRRRLDAERAQEEATRSAREAAISAQETLYGGEMQEHGSFSRRYETVSRMGEEFGQGYGTRMAYGLAGMANQELRARAATELSRALAAEGVTGTRLDEAETAAQEEEARYLSMSRQLARTPVDLGLQRDQSYTAFQIQVLSNVPGSYGNLRGALGAQMGFQEQEARQVMEMMERQRNAGLLTPAAEFDYQQRLQKIAMSQLSTYNQLSYGWESRLASQMLGSPGNFNLEARGFSWRNAVQRGIVNPHFGATQEQVPFFLDYASVISYPQIPGFRGPYPNDKQAGVYGLNLPGMTGPGSESGWRFGGLESHMTPWNTPAEMKIGGSSSGEAGLSFPRFMQSALLGILMEQSRRVQVPNAHGQSGRPFTYQMETPRGGPAMGPGMSGPLRMEGELVLKDMAGNPIGTATIRGAGQQGGGAPGDVPTAGPWTGFNALAEEINRMLTMREGALDQ